MKFFFLVALLIHTVFANESLNSIYENILLKNSKNSVQTLQTLQMQIEQNKFDTAKEEFKKLVLEWKSIETIYVLGELEDAFLDMPRYIDIFHQGNENIQTQLDLILVSKEDLRESLYKNSHKTINALEYILFTKDLKNERAKEMAQRIAKKIEENLGEISKGYLKSKTLFVNNEQKANSILLNALIESAYKLKEWRVGDTAGLSRKFKESADNQRGEYFISKSSTLAIEAILKTHLALLEKQEYKNFGTLINSYGAKKELEESLGYIKSSLAYLKEIKNDDFSNAKDLYNSLKKLHNSYYITLITKLKIKSKILDADGD
ncbi:MAG: imelysin family protein [Sulfurimonas sp.]|jgi:hypothetical protein